MSAQNQSVGPEEQVSDQETNKDVLNSLLRLGKEPRGDLDLTTVLRDVLLTLASSVDADGGSILVLDEGGWPGHWFVLEDGQTRFVKLTYAQAIVERGMVGWIVEHRQGDLIADLSTDPRWLQLPGFPHSVEQGSAICLPLSIYDRITAVLTLVHPTSGFFTRRHWNLLEDVIERVALAVENARLYETVRQRAEEMAALYEVALNLSSEQPLDRLLDAIVAQAMDLLHCQGGGLFLWRSTEGQLELVAAYDPEIDLRGVYVAPGEGLVGRVFETGEPVALDEYGPYSDEGDIWAGLPAAAAIAVPLMWQGQSIGVLMTTDRTPGRYFDHSERHLLTLLANQSAAAIASAQLHEQTTRRLQELVFLNETIKDITATLDLEEIFSILTRRVKDLIGTEACSIALADRDRKELVFRVASGGGAETVLGVRVPWGQGIVGAAAESGKPINVPNVQQDDRFYKEVDKIQSEFVTHSILAAPMISRGQVVGVVEGLNKPGGFDAEDERLLSALASLAASVVENASLFSSARAAEMRYQALFEDAADAVWVTDAEGQIMQANLKAAALTGHDDQSLPGMALWALTPPEEHRAWQEALAQALAQEEPTFESWIVGAGGSHYPLELRLKRVRVDQEFDVRVWGEPHSDGTRVQWIGRDISARRELEQLRENLTHMIVHDLRSPVGTVSSSLGLLNSLVGQQAPGQAGQLIDIAARATQRLSNLVDSLLDISRLEAGQKLTDQLPVAIKPLIESAVDQMALYVKRKKIALNVDLAPRLPFILADGGMIERVLVNLLDNALKFTPAGGEVHVSAAADEAANLVEIRVRDNGPGIPPRYQRRIFDKFARVQEQPSTKGIGLGLAFCRLAVEAHGGRIWVESAPGQGSTFVFTLPLVERNKRGRPRGADL